jgi:hypothetical protein
MSTIKNNFAGFSLENRKMIDEAMERAARDALLAHKRAGVPIAVSRNGRVVLIPPQDIRVDSKLGTDGNANSG